MSSMKQGREFLKAHLWDKWDSLDLDQRDGIPQPPYQKPHPGGTALIDLVPPDQFTIGRMSVLEAIQKRKSRRGYTGEPLTQEELSYLLWATQGVRAVVQGGKTTMRTVPSAGSRHPFETYFFANAVEGLGTGIYRYIPVEHKLLPFKIDDSLLDEIHKGTNEQFVLQSAMVFIWTVIPYRSEWRYGPLAHKMIAQDSGHLCQNLYIACESLGIGTCAIGAYNQQVLDRVLDVDGIDEFTIYTATVGRVASG